MQLVKNEPSEELLLLLERICEVVMNAEATSLVVVVGLRGGGTSHTFSSMQDAAAILGELEICKTEILERVRENDD